MGATQWIFYTYPFLGMFGGARLCMVLPTAVCNCWSGRLSFVVSRKLPGEQQPFVSCVKRVLRVTYCLLYWQPLAIEACKEQGRKHRTLAGRSAFGRAVYTLVFFAQVTRLYFLNWLGVERRVFSPSRWGAYCLAPMGYCQLSTYLIDRSLYSSLG